MIRNEIRNAGRSKGAWKSSGSRLHFLSRPNARRVGGNRISPGRRIGPEKERMNMGREKTKEFKLFTAALLFCVCTLFSPLTGCSANSAGAASSAQPESSGSSAGRTSSMPESSGASGTRTVTDMMGNEVTIPSEIKKVYCSTPIGSAFLYTLAPDELIGWNWELSEEDKTFLLPECRDLPVLGGAMAGQNSINTESVIKLKPDLILDFEHEGKVSTAVLKLSEQTGIPILEASSALDKTEECYRFLGDILGRKERGDQLADSVKKTLENTKEKCSKVPGDKILKVYYSESADGLKTDGSDSMHTEAIKFVNAENVVQMKTTAMAKGTAVSMEQVLAWNPDVILVSSKLGGKDFMKSVYRDEAWKSISAVENKRIYCPVSSPFNWFDRPPCVARTLGVEWLASVLYPDCMDVDMKSEVKNFYSLFYQVPITDEQAEKLLDGTKG